MDILRNLNKAISYVEANLCDEIDDNRLAAIACMPADSFARLFRYVMGITLKEYIRCRRMTLAAYELRDNGGRVLDVAVKYGYNSADAFTKAFTKQHGITPAQARDPHRSLKVYPPASFSIIVQGGKEMDFRILEVGREGIPLRGLWKQFTGTAGGRFEQVSIMWGMEADRYVMPVGSECGTWYGIWDGGRYWIAKAEGEAGQDGTEFCVIPSGTYAVFSTEYGRSAGSVLPMLRKMIFDSWLPDSGYEQVRDYEVEVYYLASHEERCKRHYEIWIPVEKAGRNRTLCATSCDRQEAAILTEGLSSANRKESRI